MCVCVCVCACVCDRVRESYGVREKEASAIGDR